MRKRARFCVTLSQITDYCYLAEDFRSLAREEGTEERLRKSIVMRKRARLRVTLSQIADYGYLAEDFRSLASGLLANALGRTALTAQESSHTI